jgi:hypothetical protein
VTLGADWQVDTRWTLAGSVNAQRGRDSLGAVRSDGWGLQGQITRRIEVPLTGGRTLPGQWFVRAGDIRSRDRNEAFGLASDIRQWDVDFGLSITVF